MKISIRGLSTFLASAAFVAFACFAGPNCQPTGGDLSTGDGGRSGGGDGGKSGGDGGSSGSGGKTSGGSGGADEGGSSGSGSGGKTGSGGSAKGGSGSGGSAKGGSSGSGNGGSGSGGSDGSGGVQGSGGTSSSTTATGGSGGAATSALKCAPTTATTPAITSKGGLACPGGLCTVGTYSGYLYVYSDGEKSGPSKVCAGPDSLCASGSTGVADTKGTIWGAGVGFNLDKAATPAAVQLSGTGMTYALSAMPAQGMRAQVTVAGSDYCVKLASASGTVAWTDFNTACWDDSGTALTGAPNTPHVAFQVTAGSTAGNFDFCVKSVSFE
jgi:hypothetical protein